MKKHSWKAAPALRKIGPLIIAMAALEVVFGIRVPGFSQMDNQIDLLQQISVNAIIAFGMTFTIMTGGIDLSVGAVLALVGTATVSILAAGSPSTAPSVKLLLALGGGMGIAALFGLFNGIPAAKTRMPTFVITLSTMMVARGMAYRFNSAQPIPIPDNATTFLALGNSRLLGFIPVPVLVMLGVFAFATILLHRTRFGQHIYAIGGNREAAKFTGINVVRTQVWVYLLCAVMAGIAGMIHTSQLYSAEPGSGQGFELNAIAAAVVGGTSFTGGIGTMYGTLIGAVIIGILDKGLNQAGVHFSLQYIVKGLVVLTAVYMDVRRNKS